MSEGNDAKELGILQQLQSQHAMYCAQREQAQITFQQLTGAIFACESMIKQHEDNLKKAVEKLAQEVLKDKAEPQAPTDNQGEIKDGKADDKTEEPVA